MKLDQYKEVANALVALAGKIEDEKRPSYTMGDDDVLKNFKRISDRLPACKCGEKIPPGVVLAVYMLKHIDSIVAVLCRPDLPQAEQVRGRFADAVNYLKLGYALHTETTMHQAKQVEPPYPQPYREVDIPLNDLPSLGRPRR